MHSFMRLGFALALLSVMTGHAHAQTDEAENRWQFTATIYGWLSGIDGKVATFGAPEADASTSLDELVERLDGAFMGILEARRGRFLVAGDLLWARLEQDEDANLGMLASGVKLTTENTMATGVVGYTVIRRPEATLDVIAGARYWSVDNELEFRGGSLGGDSFSDSEDWVDPVAGISGRRDLGAKTYFTGWAVAGGFGSGSDSMWDAMAAVGYRFNDHFSSVAGYRALSIDYENDGFLYDVEQSGIMLGAVYAF